MRRRRVLAGTLAALVAAVPSLAAQQQQDTTALVNGLGVNSPELKARLEGSFWQALASTPCPAIAWTPSFRTLGAYRRSVEPIRIRLDRETGVLPPANGFAAERTIVQVTPRYVVERLRIDDRLPGSATWAYMARPVGVRGQSPAVVVLHGSGVHPGEALGWTEEGQYFDGERSANPAFAGVAAELADAGYTVFVPWIADDYGANFFPRLRWESLARAGMSLRLRTGGRGTFRLTTSQVAAAFDFMQRLPSVDATRFAVLGWGEGAQIAAAAAALDQRVTAVVQLAPPIDRRALRATVAGLFTGAPFTHSDCALGDEAMAALIAPRPLLKAYAVDDGSVAGIAGFISPAVTSAIQATYNRLRFPARFAVRGAAHFGAAERRGVRQWLDSALAFVPRAGMEDSVRFIARAPDPYHLPRTEARRDDRFNYAASLGTCIAPPFTPDFSTIATYQASTARLRARIAASLGVGVPRAAKITILTRTIVRSTNEYVLSFVTARSARTPILISGLLATPRNSSARRMPAVVSLDGNYGLGDPFGLPKPERTPYLNAYAERLAATGTVVFVPFAPAEFPEIAASELKARGAGLTSMSLALPVYWAGVDLLTSFEAVDPARVAVWGISYAGIAALYVGALDTRIAATVYSNPVITVRTLFKRPDSVHLAGWYPEVCSTLDLVQAYLIAPRRLIRENGLTDVNGFEDAPLETVELTRQTYRELGLEDQFQFIRHYGGHETRGEGFQLFSTSDRDFRN